jgi:hypothetical protein
MALGRMSLNRKPADVWGAGGIRTTVSRIPGHVMLTVSFSIAMTSAAAKLTHSYRFSLLARLALASRRWRF